MDADVALEAVKQILAPQPLSYVEELVVVRTWRNQLYREMAIDTGYEEGYLKDIGSRLWQTLSQRLGYPVSKKRLRFILAEVVNSSEQWSPPAIAQVFPKQHLEFPGSPLPFQSSWYIPRPPLEEMAHQALKQPGSLIRIKGCWRVGKTSFINQLLGCAQQDGMSVASVDLRQADMETFESFDTFCRWFCSAISQPLNLDLNVDDHWFAGAGSKLSCTAFIQDQVLSRLTGPLVIVIDTLHHLSGYPTIASNFLAMLRAWYEQARSRVEWGQLRLVLAYAAELDLPLQHHQSPFNVGLPLELPMLTLDQVEDLVQRYQLTAVGVTQADLEGVLARIGTHPYLLQLAFYWLQSGQITPTQLVDQAATDDGIYGEHLHRLWALFQQSPHLEEAWQQVLDSEQPVTLAAPLAHRLEAMGLIQMEGGRAKPGCSLCRDYFTALYSERDPSAS
ncbi:MAG: AAA-like domain-containing protein [Leptolyngbya sp.]|nr:AAA-like domain-containing protein [Leptolyngbya sp.]